VIVKSLAYKNFRQFKGEGKIEFSTDKVKNVTIILGDNTYGKTTLLQMFNWCFYDKAIFNENPDFLLNLEVSNAMFNGDTEEVYIQIVLEHDNKEYTIYRKQEYIMVNGSVRGKPSQLKIEFKDLSTGITSHIHRERDMISLINTILPYDLSGYFFFDTERVQNISFRKDLADAVKGLLGLDVLDNTIKHLGKREAKTTVIGSFYADLNLEQDAQAQEALRLIQQNEEALTIIERQKSQYEDEIGKYENRKLELEERIRRNEATTKLQEQKDKLVKDLESEYKALERAYNGYRKEFADNSVHFFSQPLLEQASELLSAAKVDDKGIKDVTAESIKDIIKRGRCLCGTEIKEGNEYFNNLIEALKFVPPESIGTTIRNFKNDIINFNRPNKNDKFYESLESRMKDILLCKRRITEWEDDIKYIEKQIEGKEDTRNDQVELNEIRRRIRELNRKREQCIAKMSVTEKDIERYKKIFDSLTSASEKNNQIRQYLLYAEAIYQWIDDYYRDKEKDIRVKLEEKVNEIFNKMYHGERRVVIDEKYNTTLLTKIDDKEVESGESEGLLRVKNFAFIAGLVDLARSKIINIDGQDLGSEPYPLILDAPFSNADEIHIENISRELPKVAEQVIMFVMAKDWRYAEAVMLDRVDKQYKLVKHSDTYTTIN